MEITGSHPLLGGAKRTAATFVTAAFLIYTSRIRVEVYIGDILLLSL